jgi:hypothetical protein
MVQGRSRLRLSPKPGQGLGIVGYFIRQKLQGDESVQGRVLSLVHHTHPPPPSFSVMRQCDIVWPIMALEDMLGFTPQHSQ